MKIGALLMVGLFTVQLDFKSTLIENDVDIETIDISIIKNAPAIAVIQNLEIESPVSAPLKYPLFELQSNLNKENTFIYQNLTTQIDVNLDIPIHQNPAIGYYSQLINETNQYRNIIEGLFRLDIGEGFIQKT